MNSIRSFILATILFGSSAPVFAQTTTEMPLPQAVHLGPPPKRGEAPRRVIPPDPTKNNGKVLWSNLVLEYQDIVQGSPKTLEIEAKNTSQEDLNILEAKGSCHCISIKWTETPIRPGETGKLIVTHDAADLGAFYRIVGIQTNFDLDNWLMVPATGTVIPK